MTGTIICFSYRSSLSTITITRHYKISARRLFLAIHTVQDILVLDHLESVVRGEHVEQRVGCVSVDGELSRAVYIFESEVQSV